MGPHIGPIFYSMIFVYSSVMINLGFSGTGAAGFERLATPTIMVNRQAGIILHKMHLNQTLKTNRIKYTEHNPPGVCLSPETRKDQEFRENGEQSWRTTITPPITAIISIIITK
jgi:hypothetical protein